MSEVTRGMGADPDMLPVRWRRYPVKDRSRRDDVDMEESEWVGLLPMNILLRSCSQRLVSSSAPNVHARANVRKYSLSHCGRCLQTSSAAA